MLTKILTLFFLLPSFALASLRVVTTTEDLTSLTKTICADKCEVNALVRGAQDPHFIEAKPSFLVSLSRADLLIAVGLSLEGGWLPLLQRGARHPRILPGHEGYLDASESIQPMEKHEKADRSEGDVHPEGNPHYMADPERGLQVAEKITAKLSELDKQNAAFFQSNLQKFQKEFRGKIESWKKRLAKYKGTKIFGYHKSFNYFFAAFGLDPVAYLEPKPGIPPTAQHILKLIEIAKAQKVKLIVMEDYFDSKAGRSLSEKTGIKLVEIPAYTGGHEKAKSYTEWLDYVVSEVERQLGP